MRASTQFGPFWTIGQFLALDKAIYRAPNMSYCAYLRGERTQIDAYTLPLELAAQSLSVPQVGIIPL
jgi:hypothetical protein